MVKLFEFKFFSIAAELLKTSAQHHASVRH
jgi:hypothetical protein